MENRNIEKGQATINFLLKEKNRLILKGRQDADKLGLGSLLPGPVLHSATLIPLILS